MWPSVNRINAAPLAGTLRFDYTIVSDRYFNSRQKQALKSIVEQALGVTGAEVSVHAIDSLSPSEYCTLVKAKPGDSTAGKGSFLVLKTLQETLAPHFPYTAVGYWFVNASVAEGTYLLGLRFLGDPSAKEIREFKRCIRKFNCVERLDSSPFKGQSLHFALLIRGNPNESKEDAFRRELRAAGSSLVVSPTTQMP